jgi:hypothetical protein
VKKIITSIGIVIFFGALIISPLFIKVEVGCRSQYGECSDQIKEKLNAFNGKSLVSARRGVRKTLKADFLVSDFSIQFKLPNTLQVELLVKKPVFSFKDSQTGSLALVDRDGQVLSLATESVLPVVISAENLPGIGEYLNVTGLFALKLAMGVYQMYDVRTSIIQDGSLLVELPGQIRVIFPLEGDSDILLGGLRLIYSKIKEDGNLAGYSQIDMRYKNPVLR